MNNKVIIFTDLDGSLLDRKKFHFGIAKQYIHELIARGILLIPNTSKTEEEIKSFLKELNIKIPFISENGSAIHNINLIKKTLPKKITLARPKKIIYKIFNKNIDKSIIEKCDFVFKMTKKNQTKVLGLKGKKLEASLQRKFTFPFVFKGSSKQKQILLNNSNKLGISFQDGGRVINLGDKVTKGLALKKIVKLLKQNEKKKLSTIAVGDSINDISMLNYSNYPCIISNRSIKIKNKNTLFTNKPAPMGWITIVKKAMNKIEIRN